MSEEEDPDLFIENHEQIRNLLSNWKCVGIITAFVNRNITSRSTINTNVDVKDKKPVLLTDVGDPIVLNVNTIDIYSINLHRQVHHSIEPDLQYLRPNNIIDNVNYKYSDEIPKETQQILNHLLIGLTTLNEHIFNFISESYENLHDQKIKKVIEYLLNQRDYYLSIGRVKTK